MTVPDELVWLIGQLRGTASRRERIRLLARGWRTLRDLSPADRLAVAHELGFDGAEQLVEQLARRGGVSPAKVLEMLERAEEAGPEQIAVMVRDAVDPEGRKKLGARFLEAAKTWVADLEPWDPDRATGEFSDPAESDEGQQPQPEAVGPAIEPPAPPLPATTMSDPELVTEREAEPAAEPRPSPEPESDPRSEIRDAGSPTLPGRKEAERGPEPRPEPVVEPVPAPPRTRMDAEELEQRLNVQHSVIRRLRDLAAVAPDLVDADPDTMTRIVESFPDGWMRRRAVVALLHAGVPRSFDAALAMIASIEDQAQRRWAVSTLIQSRPLMPEDEEKVLQLSPSPVLRRRLQRQSLHRA